MQYFSKGNKEAMINLAKNPAGMNASLSVGEQLEGKKVYVISLNDNAADGRDTSWIYDADFEKLTIKILKLSLLLVHVLKNYNYV